MWAQLEHVVAFLSKHADGILKNQVQELQNQLIELRASLPAFLRTRFVDGVHRLVQFMMTSPTLRRHTSGPNTSTARRMALITIFAIPAWARRTCRMRAACSKRTLSRVTCFPMLVLSSILCLSVKRLRSLAVLTTSSIVDVWALVRQAPGWAVQYDVFICGACYPYVSLIAFFFCCDVDTY